MFPNTVVKTVRLGGKAALPTAHTTAALFLEQGFDHVFIVFDADTTDQQESESQRLAIEETLAEHGLSGRVTVIPVVPTIHVWLSPRHRHDRPAPERLSSLVNDIDLQLLEREDQSFANLARDLRKVVRPRARRSA